MFEFPASRANSIMFPYLRQAEARRQARKPDPTILF